MAALSRANVEEGPGPLEGLHPDVLLKGVQAALEAGLVDDLDWLAPEAAGVALYTLAAALPVGAEQRELGRRVLARMLAGSATSFTAMATVMAQTGGKGLSSPAVRARVALLCELPLSHGVPDGPLTLALVSRRENAREWVTAPSTRSLPARRLAAKIIERAAREAARRAQMGDRHSLRAFQADAVKAAWDRLLADRESLVWRHVAVARGLLAPWTPELLKEVETGLQPGLSPTEWRRASTSLAAYAAVRPDEALKTTQAAAKRELFSRVDPPSAAAFLWGLPRAVEGEPEIAAKLVDIVLANASADAIGEAVLDLASEHGPSKVVERASRRALDLLRATSSTQAADDGAEALRKDIERDLEGTRGEEATPLRIQVQRALDAFVSQGALAAYARARAVLSTAQASLDKLETSSREGAQLEVPDLGEVNASASAARRTAMVLVRDLDASLLERHTVADMLKLGGSAEQVRASEDAHDALRERLAECIVSCEVPEGGSAANAGLQHVTLRLRRLRALLHLLDGILGEGLETATRRAETAEGADVQRAKRLRALWLRAVKALLEQFEGDPPAVLRRTMLASIARALDALVRLGACDVTDALLVLALRIRKTDDFEALAEASMDPDLEHVLTRYAKFLRDSSATLEIAPKSTDPSTSTFPPSIAPETSERDERLAAFEELANELAPEASARSEALRTVLTRLHGALVALATAPVLRALGGGESGENAVVASIETWVAALAQMCLGARGRLDPELPTMAISPPQPRLLSGVVARVLAGQEEILSADALAPAIDEVVSALPHGIARLVAGLLWRIADLPVDRPSFVQDVPLVAAAEQLPAWLPPRRILGGFFVQRALGVGGIASVFVVTRAEERADPDAERFALKVPDYNATAARSVSQEEFMRLFREEASALIMLPNHVNLARFVTFDVGAKPLPILVMELVEGSTLEWMISSRTFDTRKCLAVMDDVLAGLEAMHSVGIGHLDLKPSNVVLRRGEQGVLVDFGLSGRKIRVGCGTGPYGSPEVWGVVPDGAQASPMAADIYAFGCMAFEMLTAAVLFDAPNEVTQITMHVSHDGNPMPLRALVANPEVGPLAEVLAPTLRRDPAQRPTAEQLRREIRAVAGMVADAPWPARLVG